MEKKTNSENSNQKRKLQMKQQKDEYETEGHHHAVGRETEGTTTNTTVCGKTRIID